MFYTPKKIDYDEKYDILYCTFSSTDNSYGDEIDDNIILLRDMETEEITGITIYGFKGKYQSNSEKHKRLKQFIDMPATVFA